MAKQIENGRETRTQQVRIEHREATDEERAAGKIGTIVGSAVVYNSRTELWPGYTEEVKPGAFTDTLPTADVRALFNHDTNLILGRTTSGTLRLRDSDQSLDMEIDVPDTQAGRDLLTSIRRKDVDGASFTFSVRPGGQTITWTGADAAGNDNTHRVLTALDLYDVGPVTFPQYTDTSVAARSIAECRKEAEAASAALKNAARKRTLDIREREALK